MVERCCKPTLRNSRNQLLRIICGKAPTQLANQRINYFSTSPCLGRCPPLVSSEIYVYPSPYKVVTKSRTVTDTELKLPGDLLRNLKSTSLTSKANIIAPNMTFSPFMLVCLLHEPSGRKPRRSVKAVPSMHPPPTCMNGIRWLGAVMPDESSPAAENNFCLIWIPGEDYNHSLHCTAPERLWRVILEEADEVCRTGGIVNRYWLLP